MSRPLYECQVCGQEADPDVVAVMAVHDYQYWVLHHVERRGGVVRILTCPECNTLTEDLIFETYRERIRGGLVPGFH